MADAPLCHTECSVALSVHLLHVCCISIAVFSVLKFLRMIYEFHDNVCVTLGCRFGMCRRADLEPFVVHGLLYCCSECRWLWAHASIGSTGIYSYCCWDRRAESFDSSNEYLGRLRHRQDDGMDASDKAKFSCVERSCSYAACWTHFAYLCMGQRGC